MSRFRLLLLFLCAVSLPLGAHDQKVRNVDITLSLDTLGTASVYEKWDINTGDKITEWYLVRTNLDDIDIQDFEVLDEEMNRFKFQDSWDIKASLQEKEGRCGIVLRSDGGKELCWGIAPRGDHVFHVFYKMTNAVKSLQDYDMLHMQVLSPGLSTTPEHVRVCVEAPGLQIDTLTTRIWGFGYTGTSAFEDGKAVFTPKGQFLKDDSVIVLLRFEKGFFHSPSVQDRPFREALDIAMEGADFGDEAPEEEEEPEWADIIAKFATLILFYFFFIRPFIRMFSGKKSKREIRRVLGTSKESSVPVQRGIPLQGNLLAADKVLYDISAKRKANCLALAEILRMVHQGYIKASRELEGPLKLGFTKKDPSGLDASALELYDMIKDAAKEDGTLDNEEFSTWARENATRVYDWSREAVEAGFTYLRDQECLKGVRYTAEGKRQARAVVGLKNLLSSYTLVKERETFESGLWKEYLVYAALFGIADKVAAQMKDIDPSFFKEELPYEVSALPSLLDIGEEFASSVQKAVSRCTPQSSSYYDVDSSSGGYGGSSSSGGGGGYSGGGYGGGGR